MSPVSPVFFFNVGPPQESIFLTTFYGLYFSINTQTIQITGGLATLLEGAGLAFDIQKCSNF